MQGIAASRSQRPRPLTSNLKPQNPKTPNLKRLQNLKPHTQTYTSNLTWGATLLPVDGRVRLKLRGDTPRDFHMMGINEAKLGPLGESNCGGTPPAPPVEDLPLWKPAQQECVDCSHPKLCSGLELAVPRSRLTDCATKLTTCSVLRN